MSMFEFGITTNVDFAVFQTVGVEADKVEVQGKQMVEERQGAWELHYSNAEIMFRYDKDLILSGSLGNKT